jgi:hypothetical protein
MPNLPISNLRVFTLRVGGVLTLVITPLFIHGCPLLCSQAELWLSLRQLTQYTHAPRSTLVACRP